MRTICGQSAERVSFAAVIQHVPNDGCDLSPVIQYPKRQGFASSFPKANLKFS
jgi:hypothetical protein